jgi:hypothetical protein
VADWAEDFLAEFADLQRSLESVWKTKLEDYSDRIKKEQAYNMLVTKVKTVDKNANCDTVVKRIYSLLMTVGPFTGASKLSTVFQFS